MKFNDIPEHDCPACAAHPPLIYRDSTAPGAATNTGVRMDTNSVMHFFKCAICGGDYMAMSGAPGPNLTPPNQMKKTPVVECFQCGGQMRAVVAKGLIADSTLRSDRTSKAETMLAWRCDCGAIDKFADEDILL